MENIKKPSKEQVVNGIIEHRFKKTRELSSGLKFAFAFTRDESTRNIIRQIREYAQLINNTDCQIQAELGLNTDEEDDGR